MIHFPTGTKCVIKSRSYTIHAWWNELGKDRHVKHGADMYQFIDDETKVSTYKSHNEVVLLYSDGLIKNIKY